MVDIAYHRVFVIQTPHQPYTWVASFSNPARLFCDPIILNCQRASISA